MLLKPITVSLFAGSLLLLTACGSAPPAPNDALARVETAIASAKDKEADTYATTDLLKAEKKLADAKLMIEQESMDKARLTLEQALADAKLAESKADAARAKKQHNEMKDAVDTLRKETQRN